MRHLRNICLRLLLFLTLAAFGTQTNEIKSAHAHRGPGQTNSFNLAVPAHAYDLILARPERNSITLSVLAYQNMEGFLAYGTRADGCTNHTPMRQFQAGMPVELVISSLEADTGYYYHFCARLSGATQVVSGPEFSFHTARPPGSSFTFTMTADAHLDEHTSAQVYQLTLANIRADKPDFHIDLGNLFMTDKHATRDEAFRQYLAQRFYLGQIGCTVPVLLALGTHDGESSRYEDASSDCLAVWSNLMRKHYFPNPLPDNFYSGDELANSYRGLREDYYAWEWGDALFVVLDPFGYSTGQRGSSEGWNWSLGQAQYQWLKQTLERSRSRFKFVFIHNLLCGDPAARGGVEVAPFNEWGGMNRDGSEGFKERRPGWDLPVHQLLVRNHVAAVFKAHDNFYARQELDGILYLMVPQPSFAGNDRIRDLQAYGYKQGVFLGNSGHVRVSVSAKGIGIEYIKASSPAEVADACAIAAEPTAGFR